jgi:hypothetical protein
MNIMWMPNSPIKDLTIQYAGRLSKDDYDRGDEQSCVPTFLGYGREGALSRFKSFEFGPRDPKKRHPASIGKRKGLNNVIRKEMDISAKFTGNFNLEGIVRDANNTVINNCSVKLFRTDGDKILDEEFTDANGVFRFVLSNNTYTSYYIVAKRTDIANTAGVTSYTLNTAQV